MELCKYCDGICCLNPPQLYPEEAEQIKKAGAEFIGFEKQGKVFVSVKPVKNQCPFLEDGKCRIYDKRPKVCRQFECINMHTPLPKLAKCEPARAIMGFVKPYNRHAQVDPNIAWDKKEAQRMGVHIVSMKEFLTETAVKEIASIAVMALRTLLRVSQQSTKEQ